MWISGSSRRALDVVHLDDLIYIIIIIRQSLRRTRRVVRSFRAVALFVVFVVDCIDGLAVELLRRLYQAIHIIKIERDRAVVVGVPVLSVSASVLLPASPCGIARPDPYVFIFSYFPKTPMFRRVNLTPMFSRYSSCLQRGGICPLIIPSFVYNLICEINSYNSY